MKKILAVLVAASFATLSGFAAAQAAPAQGLVPSVQAAPDAPKAGAKAKAKKSKAKPARKAKARK